jgi:molybdopterin-guanine dinucleotide biosynthesis protein A
MGAVVLQATLLLLAGGESRRMGRSKALLPVAGTTLVEWVAARLSPGFASLLVAARDADQLPPALRPHLVRDLHRGAGPLAGVEAGLGASPHDIVVAVACDMPAVTPDLTARLVEALAAAPASDAAVPRVRGRPEPACAAYRRSASGPIAGALRAERLRAAAALADLDVRWLDGEDPGLFANLNTPDDYRGFLARLTPAGGP